MLRWDEFGLVRFLLSLSLSLSLEREKSVSLYKEGRKKEKILSDYENQKLKRWVYMMMIRWDCINIRKWYNVNDTAYCSGSYTCTMLSPKRGRWRTEHPFSRCRPSTDYRQIADRCNRLVSSSTHRYLDVRNYLHKAWRDKIRYKLSVTCGLTFESLIALKLAINLYFQNVDAC